MARTKREKSPRPDARSERAPAEQEAGSPLLERVADFWRSVLERPRLWFAVLVVAGSASLLPTDWLFSPRVEVGAIADRDYLATEDVLIRDEATTLARQEQARQAVSPVYDMDASPIVAERLTTLFEAGRGWLDRQPGRRVKADAVTAEVAAELAAGASLKLTREQAGVLAAKGFASDLEDRLQGIVELATRRGMVSSKETLLENRARGIVLKSLDGLAERRVLDLYDFLAYPEEVHDLLESEMRGLPGLSALERRRLVGFLETNLKPNVHLNQAETQHRQDRAAEETPTSLNQVRRGQVLARKGDQLDERTVRTLSSLRRGSDPIPARILQVLATLALVALVALFLRMSLREERAQAADLARRLSAAFLMLAIAMVGTRLAVGVAAALANAFESSPLTSIRSWSLGVPFAALAVCTALVLGRQAGMILSVGFAFLAARLPTGDGGVELALYVLAGSLAAVFSLDRYPVRQRLVMTRVGLVVSGVNGGVALLLAALSGEANGGGWSRLGFDLLMAFAGGLSVAAVASFVLPILEVLVGVTTDIKLAELANTNLPVLRRLAFEAPGSFQHSLMVANLAKQACEAIGADAPLAYTAGLYHDVGKVFRSEYFIENQRGGVNPHDKLLPTMSALILIGHIKDGVELARRHHLPTPLVDAIRQHHGTRLIKFFYNRALEASSASGHGAIEEASFRYPGPKPQNKVMGVLMLADAVEAASRTLIDPTEAKLRALIRTIVEDCLHDGQLDETDLTLADLHEVSESFLRVLTNIYHQRIDYPGFDFNARPSERPSGRLSLVRRADAS